MKYKAFRLIALFVLIASMSSCFEGRWGRYHNRHHYVHKKHYRQHHERRHGDW